MKKITSYLLILGLNMTSAAYGYQKRTIRITDKSIPTVYLKPGWVTILSLPLQPKHVIKASKAIEVTFQRNDILIMPKLSPHRTNLVIYAEGIRYAFNLQVTNSGRFDELVEIRHRVAQISRKEKTIQIPYSDE